MNIGLWQVFLVGAGGFLGAILRFGTSVWLTQKMQSAFPYGTFVVNMLGCLVLGIVLGQFSKHSYLLNWQLFLATGFCGGFTTFSAFSFESLQLFRQNALGTLILYIGLSVILGILAAAIGYGFSKT